MIVQIVFIIMSALLTAQDNRHDIDKSHEDHIAHNHQTIDMDTVDISKSWKTIDSLLQIRQPRSVDAELDRLIPALIQNNKPYDLIKAHLYKANVIQNTEREGDIQLLEYLETILKDLESQDASIMKSYLAEFYVGYLNRNLYRLRSATQVDRPIPDDMRSWTAYDFRHKILQYYFDAAVDSLLDLTPIEDIDILIQKGRYSDGIVKTAQDLMMARAIDYLSSPLRNLPDPINTFDFNQEGLYASYETFIKTSFETPNENDLRYRAIKLYQMAIQKVKNNPEALFYFDKRRLDYVKSNINTSDIDSIYKARIKAYLDQHKNEPIYTEIAHAYAVILRNEGATYDAYNPLTQDKQWQVKAAHDLLTEAIAKFPDSYGTSKCKSLIQEIERKEINITLPTYIQPALTFPVGVRYKNVNEIVIMLFNVSDDERKSVVSMNIEERKQYFKKQSPTHTHKVSLPATKDFQSHQLDYLIEGLEQGQYLAYVTYPGAQDNDIYRNIQTIQVTHLDAFIRQNEDGTLESWTTDRRHGGPIKKATVELYQLSNERGRLSEPDLVESKVTDKNGYTQFKINGRNSYRLKITHDGSSISPDNFLNQPRINNQTRQWLMYMTDRSIYRPGQTVYFKALVLSEDPENDPVIQVRKKVNVNLYDANQKIIDTLSLTSDEYGSISGHFILPMNALQGNFSISAENMGGRRSINVESYKRPRFEVVIDTLTSNYRIGDTIKVTGHAKMYAGTPVRQAEVKVSVRRSMNYSIFPWRFRHFPSRDWDDVHFDLVQTDDEGRFEFEFVANKSADHRSNFNPVYRFQVEAEVTDQTGETRSGQSVIPISTKPFIIQLDIASITLAEQWTSINYDVTNSTGQTQSTDVGIKVTELKAPDELIERRRSTRPDQFLYTEDEFKAKAPHIEYKDEAEYDNWKKESILVDKTVNPSEQKKLSLTTSDWPSGVYEVTLTLLSDSTLTVTKYIKVINPNSKENNGFNSKYEMVADKDQYDVGEQARITLINGHGKESCVYLGVEKPKSIEREGWKKLKGIFTFGISVSEKDYGGFHVNAISAYRSTMYPQTLTLNVPYTHKVIDIELLTERLFTEPGSQEKWTLKLENKGKPMLQAQVTAAMYDASLDALISHNWESVRYRNNRNRLGFTPLINQFMKYSTIYFWSHHSRSISVQHRSLDNLNRFGIRLSGFTTDMVLMESNIRGSRDAEAMEMNEPPAPSLSKSRNEEEYIDTQDIDNEIDFDIPVRENLNETVFFYPDMETDSTGQVHMEFTMNEALTRWRLMVYAHDKSLAQGSLTHFIETRKELMVFPNVPRFVRQNDLVFLPARVENTSGETVSISATIELSNAINGQSLDHWIASSKVMNEDVQTNASGRFEWVVQIPQNFTGMLKIVYKAGTGQHTDAEEHIIPVLTNRMVVTETLPLWVNNNESRAFSFDAIQQLLSDKGIQHHQYTLEFTDNPSWFALMALPVLLEQNRQTADALAAKFYANSIATYVSQKAPHLKEIFQSWASKEELISELDKNEELKSKVLAATPWVRQAESEALQRKRIGLLFDLNKVENDQKQTLNQLKDLQQANGGFSWYPGGRANWYTTQSIVEMLGHLDKIGVRDVRSDETIRTLLYNAIGYLDNEIVRHYRELERRQPSESARKENDNLSPLVIHYLYTRSFFPDVPRSTQLQDIINFYLDQTETFVINRSTYQKTLGVLVLHRFMRANPANMILKSLRENLIEDEEMGYYQNYQNGYHWHQSPLSTHALLIEAFQEIDNDIKTVEGLKRWLLKNKQTNSWGTHQNTSKAIYALLFTGMDWMTSEKSVDIKISGEAIAIDADQRQAGTGYFKMKVDASKLDPTNPQILINNPGRRPAWGGLYWQYFQDMDRVKASEDGPFYIRKKTYRKINTDDGQMLVEFNEDEALKVGERVTVRIELRSDRPMDFVYLSDFRPAGFEPVELLSGYQWQNGIGFFKSHTDVGTDIFVDHLPAGNYIFETDMYVFHNGTFTGGPAQVQSYYAPSFSSISQGDKITVKSE